MRSCDLDPENEKVRTQQSRPFFATWGHVAAPVGRGRGTPARLSGRFAARQNGSSRLMGRSTDGSRRAPKRRPGTRETLAERNQISSVHREFLSSSSGEVVVRSFGCLPWDSENSYFGTVPVFAKRRRDRRPPKTGSSLLTRPWRRNRDAQAFPTGLAPDAPWHCPAKSPLLDLFLPVLGLLSRSLLLSILLPSPRSPPYPSPRSGFPKAYSFLQVPPR